MSIFSKVLGRTVGRVVVSLRTLDQFAPVYAAALAERSLCDKTKSNRKIYFKLFSAEYGDRAVSSIKPHEIAGLIDRLSKKHPHLAKRVLIEARSLFHEAMVAGWAESNPADAVKIPVVKVLRQRLSLDEWQQIHDYADCCSPPWVSRMMVLALVTAQRRGDVRKMRFSDVWEDADGVRRLHVEQQKSGKRVSIPLDLRLDCVGITVGEAIEACRAYSVLDADGDGYLIRKTTGGMLAATSMSWRFEQAREGVLSKHTGKGTPSSLHECRSLAEREYRDQGVNTKLLLGHSAQAMTDLYNRDRGLAVREGKWKPVPLAANKDRATENPRIFAVS